MHILMTILKVGGIALGVGLLAVVLLAIIILGIASGNDGTD